MSRRRTWLISLALSVVAASACTTTAERSRIVETSRTETSTAAAVGPAGGTTSGGEVAGPAAATGPGAVQGSAAGPAAAAAGGGGQTSAAGDSGPLKLGFWVVDATAGCKALGAKANCQNDSPYITAVVNYVNAHGGIGGRRIQPSIFVTDALGDSWAVQSAAACADLIEDKHSFAVMAPYVGGRDIFAHCAAQHGVPVVDTGYWPYDAVEYQSLQPYLYLPSRPNPDRWMAAYVNGLFAQGYFDPGAKIGLVRFDAAPFTRVTDTVLKPALAAHGLHLTDDIAVATPQSTTDLGPMSGQLSNAILKLRSDGVDHVLIFDLGTELTFFLLPQAEGQGYRPRYGFNSYSNMNLLLQNVPHAQLERSLGVGWSPVLDVAPADDPGSPVASMCKSIYHAAGLTSATGRSLYCDTVLFFKAALERATSISAAGMRDGVSSLGTSYQASMLLGTAFDASRYDGASATRDFAYLDSCGCFEYRTTRAM